MNSAGTPQKRALVTTIAAAIDNSLCTLVDLMKPIYISNFFALQSSATQMREQKNTAAGPSAFHQCAQSLHCAQGDKS
jgi:hypothetical protein